MIDGDMHNVGEVNNMDMIGDQIEIEDEDDDDEDDEEEGEAAVVHADDQEQLMLEA